jgi:ribosomal subunit interface protein
MSIAISGKHMDIGQSLTQHVTEGLNSAIGKYMGGLLEGSVVFEKKAHSFKADITVHLAQNFNVRASSEEDEVYLSFNRAMQKLETRLKKYKDRLRQQRRQGDENHGVESLAASLYVVDNFDQDTAPDNPVIVAEMKEVIPTLSVSEAVMRLDLTDTPAMMFKNSLNGHFNTIYRRSDGHIGWIAPNPTTTIAATSAATSI